MTVRDHGRGLAAGSLRPGAGFGLTIIRRVAQHVELADTLRRRRASRWRSAAAGPGQPASAGTGSRRRELVIDVGTDAEAVGRPGHPALAHRAGVDRLAGLVADLDRDPERAPRPLRRGEAASDPVALDLRAALERADGLQPRRLPAAPEEACRPRSRSSAPGCCPGCRCGRARTCGVRNWVNRRSAREPSAEVRNSKRRELWACDGLPGVARVGHGIGGQCGHGGQ